MRKLSLKAKEVSAFPNMSTYSLKSVWAMRKADLKIQFKFLTTDRYMEQNLNSQL